MYNEICYTGGIYDASTGLYYLNARYYDPADKRFLTEDTYRGSENDPNTLHLYAYCANNPVNYVDPSGHFWETVIDVASIGWSAASFLEAPSWKAAGYLLWDIGATFIPFVPGSYVKKGIQATGKLKKLKIVVPTTIKELKKGKHLITGTYRSLNKMLKGQKKGRIEIHHIIEKRYRRYFDIHEKDFACVVLDKELHKKISKRYKKVIANVGGPNSNMAQKKMKQIIRYVYSDMPELRQLAMNQIEKHWK